MQMRRRAWTRSSACSWKQLRSCCRAARRASPAPGSTWAARSAGPACRSRPWAVLRACSPHGMLSAEHTKPQGAAGRSGGVGVYVGVSGNEYGALAAETSPTVSAYTATGCSLSVAAGVQPWFTQAKKPESVSVWWCMHRLRLAESALKQSHTLPAWSPLGGRACRPRAGRATCMAGPGRRARGVRARPHRPGAGGGHGVQLGAGGGRAGACGAAAGPLRGRAGRSRQPAPVASHTRRVCRCRRALLTRSPAGPCWPPISLSGMRGPRLAAAASTGRL